MLGALLQNCVDPNSGDIITPCVSPGAHEYHASCPEVSVEFFLIETGDDPDEVVSSRGEENVGYVQRAVRALESCSSVDELDGKLGSILSFDGAGFSEDQADDIKGKALELKGRMLNG